MAPLYEKRKTDYYYRTDDGGRVKLACSPHLHQHIELVYMIEGQSTGYADTAVCTIRPGDIFVVFPNQIHRFVTTEPERYMLFIVSPDMVPEIARTLGGGLPESNLLPAAQCSARTVRLLHDIAEVSGEEGDNRDLILRGYLLAFFGELFRKMPLIKIRSGDSQALKAVVDFCSQNYTRPLSLDMLEDELHISKYYISHLFGSGLNIRFNDYVNSLRVTQACRYLRQTDKSVTEISELVGFGTLRTFNRAFVRHTTLSPSDYRKNNHGASYTVSVPT